MSLWRSTKCFHCKCKNGDCRGLSPVCICILSWLHLCSWRWGSSLLSVRQPWAKFPSKSSCYTKDLCLDVTANFRAARPLSKVEEDKITLRQPSLLTRFGLVCPSNNPRPDTSTGPHPACSCAQLQMSICTCTTNYVHVFQLCWRITHISVIMVHHNKLVFVTLP